MKPVTPLFDNVQNLLTLLALSKPEEATWGWSPEVVDAVIEPVVVAVLLPLKVKAIGV